MAGSHTAADVFNGNVYGAAETAPFGFISICHSNLPIVSMASKGVAMASVNSANNNTGSPWG